MIGKSGLVHRLRRWLQQLSEDDKNVMIWKFCLNVVINLAGHIRFLSYVSNAPKKNQQTFLSEILT